MAIPIDPADTPGEMLAELGAARTRAAAADGREQDLMRLAADPLLLQRHLQREEPPPASRPVVLGMPLLTVGGRGAAASSPRHSFAAAAAEPLHACSLEAEAFTPSADDLAGAMVFPHSEPQRHVASSRLWPVAACAAGGLLVLLFLLS